ncbi:hypothetical protein HDV06_001310 [Boothiomyces sp. JEL0866]|nr:hypothetical protein HDV06_001310 [Boothiomyces sp. JEL0866]
MRYILILAQIISCQQVCTKDQTPQSNGCLPVVGSSVQDTTGSGPSGGYVPDGVSITGQSTQQSGQGNGNVVGTTSCSQFPNIEKQKLLLQCGTYLDLNSIASTTIYSFVQLWPSSISQICTQKCSQGVTTVGSDISSSNCKTQIFANGLTLGGLNYLLQVIFNTGCVQDSKGNFCLLDQLPLIKPILDANPNPDKAIDTLLNNTAIACSKCAVGQYQALTSASSKYLDANTSAIFKPYLTKWASTCQIQSQQQAGMQVIDQNSAVTFKLFLPFIFILNI